MDPDPRFVLANERTLLAWVRTSLAFIAGGLAVGSLLPRLSVPGGRRAVALALVVAGASVAVGGYLRWRNNEAALRAGRPLPPTRLPLLVTGTVVLAAIVAILTSLAAPLG